MAKANQVKKLWSNRAVEILFFDIYMEDVRAAENQTREMKKDIIILL